MKRLPRCCERHASWPQLTLHLALDFPSVAMADVIRQVDVARDVVELVGEPLEDALLTAELIARNQLMLLSGRRRDLASLDPQRHPRRRASLSPNTSAT